MSHAQVDTPTETLASARFGSSRLVLAKLFPDCGLGLDLLQMSVNAGASSYLGVLLPMVK